MPSPGSPRRQVHRPTPSPDLHHHPLRRCSRRFDFLIAQVLAGHRGYRVVQQISGIGPVFASIFVAEIGDPARFATVDKLTSWAGLTPPRVRHHRAAWSDHQTGQQAGALGRRRSSSATGGPATRAAAMAAARSLCGHVATLDVVAIVPAVAVATGRVQAGQRSWPRIRKLEPAGDQVFGRAPAASRNLGVFGRRTWRPVPAPSRVADRPQWFAESHWRDHRYERPRVRSSAQLHS